MLSEKNILICNDPNTKVVVVCHDSDWEQAKSIINEFAPIGWSEHGEIRLLEVETRIKIRERINPEYGIEREIQQDPVRLRKVLDQIAPAHLAPRTIIVGSIHLYPNLDRKSVV